MGLIDIPTLYCPLQWDVCFILQYKYLGPGVQMKSEPATGSCKSSINFSSVDFHTAIYHTAGVAGCCRLLKALP